MKYKEIEYKYNAENIAFQDFEKFCNSQKPLRFLFASGHDHFYANAKEAGAFCRHRKGPDCNQLTFKRKTVAHNSFIRTEHNLSLDNSVDRGQIAALCSEFGYEFNRSIFKTCFVYFYEWYVLSYYTCFDENMKEIGRFVELELKEDYAWTNEAEAWNNLGVLEKLCKPMGINPKARIKKSLFELFRK